MEEKNNIALNKDVVKQIQTAYEELSFKEPEIDIKKELKEYVDSLEFMDEHEREGKVTTWIKGKVNPILRVWKGKYAPSSQLLQNTNRQIHELQTLQRTEQTNMETTERQIADKKESLHLLETSINDHKKNHHNIKKIDLKYEKMKSMVLIVFSLLIAIGTFVYFMLTTVDLNWSTISKADKVAQVKEMLLDKDNLAINYYSAFEKYLPLDDNDDLISLEKLKLDDLSSITISNINLAPTPTISQAVAYDNSIIFLAFISFLLILLGKVTATLYEKMNYPKWMFVLTWILGILILIGAIYSNASLTSKKIEKTVLTDKIQALDIKLEKIKRESQSSFSTGFDDDTSMKVQNPEVLKLEKLIATEDEKLTKVIESISDFKFITMLLFLFAEVIVGSIGWMIYAEYVEKRLKVKSSGADELTQLNNEYSDIEQHIDRLKQEVLNHQARIQEARGLETDLIAIKRNLYSTSDISKIENDHLHEQISNGQLILQQAVHKWTKEKQEKGDRS